MARRGNNCRCCVCQTYGIVEVPLVREGDHYSQQNPNGKGPFRLDMGGLWLAISEVVSGALRATTQGNPLKLTGAHPVGISVPTAWHPVTVAVNGVLANSGKFAVGTLPAHMAGSVSVAIPNGPVAALEAYLELFTLPAECAVPYYGNLLQSQILKYDIFRVSSPTDDEYPYPLNVFGILPFAAVDTLAEINNTTGFYKRLVGLDKLQPLARLGIENFWVPREGIGGLDVVPVGNKDAPPPLARYSSFFSIRVGSQSRWIVGSELPWPGEQLLRPHLLFSRYSLSVVMQADGGDEHSTSPPLVTAYADRGGVGYGVGGPGDFAIQYAPGRSALAVPGFTNAPPISVGGQWVTVIHNGQSVLKQVRPTQQQLAVEMAKEGSYLLVSEVTEATDPPGWVRGAPEQAASQWLRQYGSLVIDTTPPLVGFVPLDDAYVDRFFGFELFPTFPDLIGLFSSEPINISPNRQRFGLNTKEPVTLPLQPGDYTLAAYFTDEVADRAGNPPTTSGLQPIKLIPVPSLPLRRGARGAFKLPREECLRTETQTFQHGLYHYGGQAQTFARRTAMPYVDLEFPQRGGERRYTIVDNASAIKSQQFSLLRNGQQVSATISVERITDSRFRVHMPAGPQQAGSVMFLTWTPDEGTLSECAQRQSYPSQSDFPPIAEASDLFVYVAEDTGDVFEKGQSDYVAYAPERSVCAARTSWIVLPETPPFELIDTSSTAALIGRHVSVSEPAGGVVIGQGTTEVLSDNGMYLPVEQASNDLALSQDQRVVGVGQFSDVATEGFVPQVPAAAPAQSPARCSYFGLTTTIDPCPPGFVSPCAGPSVPQKHSSVIRSTDDITGLEVQLINIENGIEKLDRPIVNLPLSLRLDDFRDPTQYNAVPDIMVMSKDPYIFSASSHGKLSSQNTWFCSEGQRDRGDGQIVAPYYPGVPVTYGGGIPLTPSSSREKILADNEHEVRFIFPDIFWAFAENVRFGDLWDGAPIPVQYWRRGSNGPIVNTPEPIVRQMTGEFWQGGMQASASAYRMARTYQQMGTATLSELVLDMSWRMTVSSAVTFTDRRYPLPQYLFAGNLQNIPSEDADQDWDPISVPFTEGFYFIPNAPTAFYDDTVGTFVRRLNNLNRRLFNSLPFVAEKKDVIRRGWITLSHQVVFSDEKEKSLAAGETVMLPGPAHNAGFGQRDYRWKIRKV